MTLIFLFSIKLIAVKRNKMSGNQFATTETCYVTRSAKSSSQFCIFCLKDESKDNTSSNKTDGKKNSLLQQRFFEMLQKHFEEKRIIAGSSTEIPKVVFSFTEEAEKLHVVSCEECLSVVKSYIFTYEKIKCLQMELDWLLDRLNKAMKYAKGGGGLTESIEFRRQFQDHCIFSNLMCFPQVPLGRICTRNISTLSSVQSSFSKEDRTKTSFEPSSERKDFPTTKSAVTTVESSPVKRLKTESSAEDDQSSIDQVQVDCALSTVIKEEHYDDNYDNVDMNDMDSPFDDYGDDELVDIDDPDWSDGDEDDEDYREKGKRKKAGKSKSKTSKKKSSQTKRTNPTNNSAKLICCQKCPKESRPEFFSVVALQVHQKYLHSNGYEMLSNTENLEVLRLNEEDLTFHGFQVSLNSCSDYFSECPQTFWSVEELDSHLKYHVDITCEECGVVKSNAVEMAHHKICHHKEKIQSTTKKKSFRTLCGKCEYSTPVEGELINHYLESHMNKPPVQAVCPICRQQFKFVEKVPLLHYLNYHDLTRLEDPLSTGIQCVENGCSAYFLTEDQLQQHWRYIHGQTAPLTKVMSEEKRLQAVAIRTKQKAFRYKNRGYTSPCEFCGKSFRAENELRAHTWRFHADQKWGDSCGKIQLTEDGLTIDEFGTNKKCICDICKNVFSSLDLLERHKLHHGKFKCNFCDVVKALATELAIHETVHNIERKEKQSLTADSIKCPRCSFITKRRPEYVDHFLETHLSLSSDRKKCPICRKPVPDLLKTGLGKLGHRNWMLGHYKEVHDKTGLDPESMPKCHLCHGYFRTRVQLDNHSREIHGKRRYECSDCTKIFDKRLRLQRHRISAHKVDPSTFPFSCSFPDCDHRFETQTEVGYHEKHAHSEKDVAVQICPQCSKKCSGTSQLLSHMKTHERNTIKKEMKDLKEDPSDSSLICEECGKSFTSKKSLGQHRRRHALRALKQKGEGMKVTKKIAKKIVKVEPAAESQPEAFVCEQCGIVYETKRQLQSHRFRHKGPEFWNFSCSVCSKKLSTRYKLGLHMRKHTGEKPFVCPIDECHSSFGFPQNLRAHMKSKHKAQ